jgi:DNA-binding response OmpR family regulator
VKTILIAEQVKGILEAEKSFFARKDIRLFTAETTDDVLSIHRTEKLNLIILGIDMPGMKCEELCAVIRSERALRAVSIVLLCPADPVLQERSSRCNANAVMTLPVSGSQVLERTQHLLSISWRESYRVLVSVNIEGSSRDKTFFGRSGDISATGMLIETERVLAQGDRVSCSFFLPGSAQLRLNGEIVRLIQQVAGAKVRQYGIKFLRIAPEAAAAIEDFIAKKSQISTSRR